MTIKLIVTETFKQKQARERRAWLDAQLAEIDAQIVNIQVANGLAAKYTAKPTAGYLSKRQAKKAGAFAISANLPGSRKAKRKAKKSRNIA